MTDNYFKVVCTGCSGYFFFARHDVTSVAEAWSSALELARHAMAHQTERVPESVIAVWERPAVSGPWSVAREVWS